MFSKFCSELIKIPEEKASSHLFPVEAEEHDCIQTFFFKSTEEEKCSKKECSPLTTLVLVQKCTTTVLWLAALGVCKV